METTNIPDDLTPVIDFHGHLCPGLLIGYRAAKAAQGRLAGPRAEDEELVCVVENDSCSVDAVQFMTGCTFGKGNLIWRDHGKQVFTWLRRPDGAGVRLAYIGDLNRERLPDPAADRAARVERLLTAPDQELFEIGEPQTGLPAEARIHKTLACDRCGEGVMETRTIKDQGQTYCLPCASTLGLKVEPKIC
ncbi:MAG: TraR/DksA C4-type zinc finger protein [Proteobacteria bacterium]|nr:TraR/DksA C4-type zinc finger protein [Pseudomonadota bacterium]MBU1740780.1 TraR/DksA C4-type zinc finger protein [Pseudomonadota bacterium]